MVTTDSKVTFIHTYKSSWNDKDLFELKNHIESFLNEKKLSHLVVFTEGDNYRVNFVGNGYKSITLKIDQH